MYLKEVKIENFRLLQDVTIALDKKLTLFVGKNNSGKTSVMEIIRMVSSDGTSKKDYKFADYPLCRRDELYKLIWQYWHNGISYDELLKVVPQTSIRFVVDYSSEGMDDNLGALTEFITDIVVEETDAIIDAIYRFTLGEEKLKNLYEAYKSYAKNEHTTVGVPVGETGVIEETEGKEAFNTDIMRRIVEENFSSLFNLKIYAVDPTDEDNYVERSSTQFRNLFIFRTIRAERNLDESDTGSDSSIRTIINRIFSTDVDNMEEGLRTKISDFKQLTESYEYDVQNEVNDKLSQIVTTIAPFGYPTADDLQLKADTSVSIKDDIINNTNLTYIYGDANETLPSTHNGLGYKNLIIISLQLQEFANAVKQSGLGAIPLLFIEEPEAHMHPQLQRTFIKYLTSVMEKMLGFNIQVLITTHASHIANTVSFQQIRYMKKCGNSTICKDINDFLKASKLTDVPKIESLNVANIGNVEVNAVGDEAIESYVEGTVISEVGTAEWYDFANDMETSNTEEIRTENEDFLQKYMEISFCDLYFCDKAIIVEGASERLLIPDMIQKLEANGKFSDVRIPLSSQYYTIMEIGGAYAFRFFDFIDFLEIPTLIITDVDYVKGSHGKRCEYTELPNTSSNATIKRWYQEAYQYVQKVQLNQIDQLADDLEKKTLKKRHIEFQLEENGYKPRSLEDAIINVNKALFTRNETDIPVYDETKDGKKTEFALKLLVDKNFVNYRIPSYIERGLIWLNSQTVSD